jgi:predicted ATP-grasp superfamily ATP-dependent carboligase
VSMGIKAIVTDARLRVAVSTIRSLGHRGIPLVVTESSHVDDPIGFRSRYAREKKVTDEPPSEPTKKTLEALLELSAGGVLVPVFTPMVFLISRYSDLVNANAYALVPDFEALTKAHDKAICMDMADSLGVPLPTVYQVPSSSEDIEKWASSLEYPVIVKYRSGEDLSLPADKRYSVCRKPSEFIHSYNAMDSLQARPVVQKYIDGADWGVAVLFDHDSRPIADFTYRSIRLRPKIGGPTVFAESCRCDELVDYAVSLLTPLKWRGMAMLDFRRDEHGNFYLLEINPRFWGSMALSIESGVDFPYLYYMACLDKKFRKPKQQDGVRVRFFPHDFLSVVEYAKASSSPFNYALSASIELLNPWLKDGLLSIKDPMPGLSYLAKGVLKTSARNT